MSKLRIRLMITETTLKYRDCEEAYLFGQRTNGIYEIQPDNDGPSFRVYCDMTTDQGGWTVFQRRKDGSQNFYLNWIDYVRGFGDLDGEFWLGLRNLQRLTRTTSQMRVDMQDWNNAAAYAKYDSMMIGDAASKYTLSISGYSGTAGDSILGPQNLNGMKFTTPDQDNDLWPNNCAQTFKGAWWYRDCHESNLNSQYLGNSENKGVVTSFADSINWRTWKEYYYSLKFTEMKVRRN